MKKSTKKLILFLSVTAFLVLSFVAVTFALGYKFDLVKWGFIKTGSLGITVNVNGETYLNDKLVGETSFLGNKFSIRRLLPRTYDFRVESNEYQPWNKLVKIEAGIFSDFPKIVLVLKNPIEEVVASSSSNFIAGIGTVAYFDSESNQFIYGNKQKIEMINLRDSEKNIANPQERTVIFNGLDEKTKKINQVESPDQSKSVTFNNHEIRIEWLEDSNYQPYKKTGDLLLTTRFSQDIKDVQWYKDSEHLIADVGGILKFIEIDTRGGTNIFDIGVNENGVFFYEKGSNFIFKISGNKLIKLSF